MVKLAALHETLPSVMHYASKDRMQGLEVVHATSHAPEFVEGINNKQVDALLLTLDLLGQKPVEAIDTMIAQVKPKVTVVVYSFTRSATRRALTERQGVQLVRSPITLEALRTQLLNSAADSEESQQESTSAATSSGRVSIPGLIQAQAPAQEYTDYQLANLQQIRSEVECECPNQVADVLIALSGFEAYSHQCENKDDKDAEIHAMLYRATGHARAIMEEAMKRLCHHEGIHIDRHGNTRMDLMQSAVQR